MRDWTRSHLRGSCVRIREVIRESVLSWTLNANMSNSTSTVTPALFSFNQEDTSEDGIRPQETVLQIDTSSRTI